MTDLSDCRCVACGTSSLAYAHELSEADAIEPSVIACSACEATFDSVWGVPFLGSYERADILGLIEIAANLETPASFTPDYLERAQRFIADYHAAADKEAILANAPEGLAPYIANRYSEWQEVERLTAGHDFRNRKVLDVGAGSGFDSYRHVLAGATVTALEFSPVLAREGRRTLGMMRWIGGFSHILPFANGSFDYVFANAALHHMRDIPAALGEMLRVLRPGGWLMTTADPYRVSSQGDDTELRTFNEHIAVLSGVNERVPPFSEFAAAIELHRDRITPEISTPVIAGLRLPDGRSGTITEVCHWDFDRDRHALARTSGSIALKVRVDRAIDSSPRVQTGDALRPADLARLLTTKSEAMARLAAYVPEEAINRAFPGRCGSKIELLNGWQIPTRVRWRHKWKLWVNSRQAYHRARWYLRRRPKQTSLHWELWTKHSETFEVLINGKTVAAAQVPAATWFRFTVPLDATSVDEPFALEIRQNRTPKNLEDGLFRVRRRRMKRTPLLQRIAGRARQPRVL